ncbi:amidohydrolase family protein [bacterium]|nr:amidohydrolase family protein [bacterium]
MVRSFLMAFLCTVAAWAQPKPADLVLRGGSIYCLDGPRSWAQTLAVRDGRIVYVGSEAGVAAYVDPSTRILELKGHMVLPGFCDAHVHPLLAGLEAMRCHLNDLPSADKVLAKIRDYAGSHPDLPWIVGSGWGLPLFAQANPTRQALDSAVADRPVALESADGHSMWLNSKALEICGINAKTPDPAGGRIEREPDGTPSGTLRENAMQLAYRHLPKTSPEERLQALRWGLDRLARVGITSFHEANAGPDDLMAYHQLEENGQLTARVVAAQTITDLAALQENRRKYGGKLLRPDAVKLFLDGVIESRTAALLDPYVGSSERGNLLYEPEKLQSLVAQLAAAGFQVHIHAIGDRAVRTALDSFTKAPGHDLRHTIAHLQLIDQTDLARFRQLGVVANVQAYWAQADEYITQFANPLLGPQRAAQQYPLASLWRSGAVLAGGSDWSVSTPNPLEAIEVALTRRPVGSNGPAWIAEERMDLPAMLAAYTINGAYLGHCEEETGSIEVGKAADLVVLERNLFDIPPGEIHGVQVTHTILDGRVIYAGQAHTR